MEQEIKFTTIPLNEDIPTTEKDVREDFANFVALVNAAKSMVRIEREGSQYDLKVLKNKFIDPPTDLSNFPRIAAEAVQQDFDALVALFNDTTSFVVISEKVNNELVMIHMQYAVLERQPNGSVEIKRPLKP